MEVLSFEVLLEIASYMDYPTAKSFALTNKTIFETLYSKYGRRILKLLNPTIHNWSWTSAFKDVMTINLYVNIGIDELTESMYKKNYVHPSLQPFAYLIEGNNKEEWVCGHHMMIWHTKRIVNYVTDIVTTNDGYSFRLGKDVSFLYKSCISDIFVLNSMQKTEKKKDFYARFKFSRD